MCRQGMGGGWEVQGQTLGAGDRSLIASVRAYVAGDSRLHRCGAHEGYSHVLDLPAPLRPANLRSPGICGKLSPFTMKLTGVRPMYHHRRT
jgi:hypothetical protein